MHRRTLLRALGGGAVLVIGGGVTAVALRPSEPPGEGLGAPQPTPTDGTVRTAPTSAPREPGTPDGPVGREAVAAPAATLALHCRDAWGARPAVRAHAAHTIGRLTVHHTAVGPAGWDVRRIAEYQARHQERGMADLAYHVLVAPTGDAYEGRPFSVAGETFTDYDPSGHLHVVLEGDFDRAPPSDAQLRTLTVALAWGAARFEVDPATIAGHQRFAATACPGGHLRRMIASGEVRAGVERLLADGGADLRRTC